MSSSGHHNLNVYVPNNKASNTQAKPDRTRKIDKSTISQRLQQSCQ